MKTNNESELGLSGSRTIFSDGNRETHALGDFIKTESMLDRRSIYDFIMYGTILAPYSPIMGTRMLFPGETANGDNEYSRLVMPASVPVDELVDRIDALFQERISTSSGAGLMLSGGVDSAILLSYLGSDTPCFTWSGSGEKSSDVIFSKITADAFRVQSHAFAYKDDRRDMEVYRSAVENLKIPILLGNAVPYLRMAQMAESQGVSSWYCGQNADTISIAYPAPFLTSMRLRAGQIIPDVLLQAIAKLVPGRRKVLLREKSILKLMAFFKSSGLYPGPWLTEPLEYFDTRETLLRKIIPYNLGTAEQQTILVEEFMTEARRGQILQNELPALYGIKTMCPYYFREVIMAGLSMEFRKFPKAFRNGYEKVIFRTLAERRGVPLEVLNKKKQGLSYNLKSTLDDSRTRMLWDEMVKDDFLNEFLDMALLRESNETNIFVFDAIRSLYYWGQWVARPLNIQFK